MNLDQFYAEHNGHGEDFDGAPADDPIQCVDLPKFYLKECFGVNPGAWGDAHAYFDGLGAQKLVALGWTKVPNQTGNPNQVPPRGAIVVWDASLSGSGGGGHIDICWSSAAGAATFVGFDQNWGGKAAKLVTHNWSKVLGWLVPPSAPAPAQAPAAPAATVSTSGGVEMIANEAQAHQAYQLLRPNGDGNPDEIASTAGKRSWVGFATDAGSEMIARNNALQAQSAALGNMQGTINSQNATITDLTTKLNDATLSNQDKQTALTTALQKIASDNADMSTAHDEITDLSGKVTGYENNPIVKAQSAAASLAKKPSSFAKLLASILASASKFKLSSAKKK